MAARKPEILVLWPEYFDSNLSRKEGRRVSMENSVIDPDCEKIYKVSRKMGLFPEIEKNKSHPSKWYLGRGRVIVRKKGKKSEVLNNVARGLRKIK